MHVTAKRTRAAGLLAGAVAMLLLVSACGSGSKGDEKVADNPANIEISGKGVSLNEYGGAELALGSPKKGGELKLGMIGVVDTLDPVKSLSTPAIGVAIGIYDTLMWVKPDGSLAPALAQSLTSTDQQHWTLKLRPNVKFTDNTPYDADAVIAHWNRYRTADATARDAGTVKGLLDDVQKTDDLTLSITLKSPYVDFPYLLSTGLGMVPSPKAVAADSKGYGQHPVGAGPFKVESFQPGGDLVVVRNSDYYDPKLPYLDKLTFVTATDSQARLAAVKSGSLDLASTTVATDLAQAKSDGLTVLQQPLFTYYVLTMNLTKPPFDDPTIREALIQAIDTTALSKAVFGGKANPMKGWFVANHPDYTQVDYPKLDVEAAKKAVADYKAKGGDPSFAIVTTPGPENQQAPAVIQQMLAAIGITVTIQTVDLPTQATLRVQGSFQSMFRFIGFTLSAVNDMNTWYHSGSPGSAVKAGDPKLDAVIDQLGQTGYDKRHDLFVQAQQETATWMPTVPLVQQVGAWIAGPKVGGFPGSMGEQTADILHPQYIWAK